MRKQRPVSVCAASADRTTHCNALPQLHVNAGLLLERFFQEGDPCIAVWLSRQFRLMSESPDMFDDGLRVMYRSIAARWHQIGSRASSELRESEDNELLRVFHD